MCKYPGNVYIFEIFEISEFSVSIFVKSTFLETQEELEDVLWICFTPGIVLLIFGEKIFFSKKIGRKKSYEKKNLSFFSEF